MDEKQRRDWITRLECVDLLVENLRMIPPSHSDFYELARELIASRLGLLYRERRMERSRNGLSADLAKIQAQIDALLMEREALSLADRPSLEGTIRRHASTVDGANTATAAIDEFHVGTTIEASTHSYNSLDHGGQRT